MKLRLFLRGMRTRNLCLEGRVMGMSMISSLDLDDWIKTRRVRYPTVGCTIVRTFELSKHSHALSL